MLLPAPQASRHAYTVSRRIITICIFIKLMIHVFVTIKRMIHLFVTIKRMIHSLPRQKRLRCLTKQPKPTHHQPPAPVPPPCSRLPNAQTPPSYAANLASLFCKPHPPHSANSEQRRGVVAMRSFPIPGKRRPPPAATPLPPRREKRQTRERDSRRGTQRCGGTGTLTLYSSFL